MTTELTQVITLPSRGLLNPEIPGGEITQRCMMVSDQKFLSGSTMSASSALHQLLQRTVTAPETFDVSRLTVYDTLFLLFKLRILSYGNIYKFKTRCPECGQKIDVQLDLSTLQVETLEEDFSDNLVVTLPHRGDTVYTRILTNRDTEEINKEIKRRKKRRPDDESEYILRIVASIEKIQLAKDKSELTHPIDIERYVSNLTDLDASAILSTRDQVVYGITPTTEYTCPECREDIDVNVHFTSEFFRPQFSR